MDIRFEQALFIQENKNEIDEVINEFKEVCAKTMSNTLVQMTNPDLILQLMDASEFVYNNDITPTSLKLIQRCLDSVKEYVGGETFQKCEKSVSILASIISKAKLNNSKTE